MTFDWVGFDGDGDDCGVSSDWDDGGMSDAYFDSDAGGYND